MEILNHCMILVIIVRIALEATLAHTLQDDQSGFISTDCGKSGGSSYTDPSTGIVYIPDAGFVDSGESESISHNYLLDSLAEPYTTVRSFPQGTRNCYTIRLAQVQGQKYLIRASFFYGNYDGKDEPPIFDLSLGADFWRTVNLTDTYPLKRYSVLTFESMMYSAEIIHVPSSDYIYVCLVKTGSYTPFISVLELRLLEDTMYATPDKSLRLVGRLNYDVPNRNIIRFKDDKYDRLWRPSGFLNNGSISIITNGTVDTSNVTLTRPPPKVMSTGLTPQQNVTGNLSFFWNPTNITTDKFYIFMHFAELDDQLRGKQLREFNIYLNGRLWYGPFSPEYLKATTIHNQIPEKGHQVYQFHINQTASSTVAPLINAIEAFTVLELSESRTEDMDVAVMLDVKSTYKLRRNWQADPCVPQNFRWDGLDCSYDAQLCLARIISLNLSSYGLNGTIAPSISNLTALQILDLSNNNLSGQVPEFLAEQDSLKILILKGNSFNGPIPERLLEKLNNGKLSLSIEDQTETLPNGTGKNMVIVPLIVSIAAALLIVLPADLQLKMA